MIDANQELALSITAAEYNVIMGALAKAPYEVVAQLIAKLQQQVAATVPDAFAPGPAAAAAAPTMNGLDPAA